MNPVPVTEREITTPISLTLANGRLNPAAVGWSRTPLIVTDGIGRGRFGWGRNKRWEYWGIATPSHIVAVVVSHLDYAGLSSLWVLDRATGEEISYEAISLLGRRTTLPGTLGAAAAKAEAGTLSVELTEVDGGTRLRASAPRLEVDLTAERPEGHESLSVVVPWSKRLFQYTVKDVARPALGAVTIDGIRHELPAGESWAVLDHGRGRWPYKVNWNWGAGSGRVGGRVIGIQVGGKWTDGTGSVENSLLVDGRLTKISEELVWEYSDQNWMAPWRVWGNGVELEFVPFHLKSSQMDFKVLASATHQCFGHWSGRVRDDAGQWVELRDLVGWAEDVHQKW